MPVTIAVTYFDTAMILLEIGTVRLLTDPDFDSAGSAFDHGPVRLTKIGASRATPESLGRIDAVLLSHDQHADNLDAGGRAFASTVPLIVTTKIAAERLQTRRAIGLSPWESTTITSPDGFEVNLTAAPAQHGPEGTEVATGPVIGFLLRWLGQEDGALYISGDTVLGPATREIEQRAAPISIAVLHLGRVQLAPMGERTFSFSAREAASYAERIGARILLPVHYEGWHTLQKAGLKLRRCSAGVPSRSVWSGLSP